MSILAEEINIAHDARRICGQEIDGELDAKSIVSKRLRLSDNHQLPNDNENECQTNNNANNNNGNPCSLFSRSTPENINELSPEVFQLIVARFLKSNNWRKLVPLRLVCKHWRSNIDAYLSSRHGFQYTGRVTKAQPPPGMNYYEFNAMLSFYPNMRQLIVKNFTVSDHLIAILRQNCPKIERLSLFGCRNLTWKGITILAVRFSQMTFLDISHCELDENRFSILCEGLQKLKIINAINPGREVTGQCLSKLGPEIEDIWIGLNHLADPNPALEALVSGNGKKLIHFGLIVTSYQKTNWNLITDNMVNLKSLKITFGSYGYGSLKNIGKLKELEFLVIAEDSRNEDDSVLNDDSLLPVIRGCNKLKSIAIAGTKAKTCRFTHRSISQIPKYCPKMEQIRFLNGHNVLDETLIELANLQCIRVLHLSSMARVGDNGVINFVKKAKNTVRNFRVSDCPNVTEAIIEPWIEVAKHRPTEKIKVYLEGISLTRDLRDLPPNLKLDVKEKSNPGSQSKTDATLLTPEMQEPSVQQIVT